MEQWFTYALGIAILVVLLALIVWWQAKKRIMPFYLYADAKPSEAIQKHELPGLAVVCVMPHKEGEPILNVPVKQY